MLYICEGVDKCGKTTYINNMIGDGQYINVESIDKYKRHELSNKIGVRFNRASVGLVYNNMMKVIDLSKDVDVYLDRSFISEVVYGPVYRGKMDISQDEIKKILDELERIDAIIFYFVPYNYRKWMDSLDSNDFFEKNKIKIQQVLEGYDKVMKNYSFVLDIYKLNFIHESV